MYLMTQNDSITIKKIHIKFTKNSMFDQGLCYLIRKLSQDSFNS